MWQKFNRSCPSHKHWPHMPRRWGISRSAMLLQLSIYSSMVINGHGWLCPILCCARWFRRDPGQKLADCFGLCWPGFCCVCEQWSRQDVKRNGWGLGWLHNNYNSLTQAPKSKCVWVCVSVWFNSTIILPDTYGVHIHQKNPNLRQLNVPQVSHQHHAFHLAVDDCESRMLHSCASVTPHTP